MLLQEERAGVEVRVYEDVLRRALEEKGPRVRGNCEAGALTGGVPS
jgi:hypothetical protein